MTIINFLYCINKANKRWWWWYLGIDQIFLLLSLNIIIIIFTIIIIVINVSFNVITIMGMITFIIINPVCVKIFSFFFFVVVQAFSICRPDSLRRNSSCRPKDWVFKCKYQSPHTREVSLRCRGGKLNVQVVLVFLTPAEFAVNSHVHENFPLWNDFRLMLIFVVYILL